MTHRFRDFPGLDVAQLQVRKACVTLRDALDKLDTVDVPLPHEEQELYALKLRGAAAVAQASALELAACAGFVTASWEAWTSSMLDEEVSDG